MADLSRRTFLAAVTVAAAGAVEPEAGYSVGGWPVALGNHCARLRVTGTPQAVSVHIPWRRRDAAAEKDIRIVHAASGEPVTHLTRVAVTRESCDLVFEPNSGPGEYHVYYLRPSVKAVAHAYQTSYPPPSSSAPSRPAARAARLLDLQARTDFDRFDPMEVVATRDEVAELIGRFPEKPFLLFPEERQHPIRMTQDLPLRWIRRGPSDSLPGEARRGEFFVFQIGVFAARAAVEDFTLRCDGPFAFRCLNAGGTDWLGRPFRKTITVAQGAVQALWCGLEIPSHTTPGRYTSRLTLGGLQTVQIILTVARESIDGHGDADLWRLSRLRWLDSTIGLEPTPTAPYTALRVNGPLVACLGREIRFGRTGLPVSIQANGTQILAVPISLSVGTSGEWHGLSDRIVESNAAAVVRDSTSESGALSLRCRSTMEFDGYINFRLTLKANQAVTASDIRLEIPLRRAIARYLMGLGKRGGIRPREWKWKWDVNHANNAVWAGDVAAGLMCKLKGPQDVWELNDLKASGLPEAWNNGGQGGCDVIEEGDRVVIRAYTGERRLQPGEELQFCFGLLPTPVKPLDPRHWSQRYYHAFAPPEAAVACGASIINIHHGNELNPWINYPFVAADKLGAYVNEAHGFGLKVKIYYTVRELSNRVAEMWALRSLGTEVFAGGPGNGHSWLQEHLVSGYTPAWHHTYPNGEVDAAIVTTGLSRWHNYYLEGLAWLIRNTGIDGLYLDGIGYDREVMKRVRRVLDSSRSGCLIDFHSGNSFDYADIRVSPACGYMEHFPYVDSLWFGEMYDYNSDPDYWLVEISGIPFGLFGEMLEKNGNPWRGMIYGMTARYYQGAEPKHIWKLWDDFGIQDARMIGYWDPACPVRTGREDVLATAYVRPGRSLIALASWAKKAAGVRLKLDLPGGTLSAPAIPGFQEARTFSLSDEIPVEPGRGWLLILT